MFWVLSMLVVFCGVSCFGGFSGFLAFWVFVGWLYLCMSVALGVAGFLDVCMCSWFLSVFFFCWFSRLFSALGVCRLSWFSLVFLVFVGFWVSAGFRVVVAFCCFVGFPDVCRMSWIVGVLGFLSVVLVL